MSQERKGKRKNGRGANMTKVTTIDEKPNIHLSKLCPVDVKTGLLKNVYQKAKLGFIFFAHLCLMATKRSAPRVPSF